MAILLDCWSNLSRNHYPIPSSSRNLILTRNRNQIRCQESRNRNSRNYLLSRNHFPTLTLN
jgi:hypothetical protein